MVKKIIILCFFLSVFSVSAQIKNNSGRTGLIKADLTFMQSFMLQQKSDNIFLGGNLEYFADNYFSVRGDCFWYIDNRQNDKIFKQNYIIAFGAIVHLPLGKSDFYAGIQPALSLTQPAVNPEITDKQYPLRLLPSFTVSAGYTLYFSRYCNFFIGVNYLISRYRGTMSASVCMDEIMVTGGLGFQINTTKGQLRIKN